jgi:GTP 3',8-cyclase
MKDDFPATLVDPYQRQISYLRLSVTDRCDFRCVYCMAEDMQFVPKPQILTLEELYRVAEAAVGLGVRKIRLTGGEPLIRNNILSLVQRLGRLPGLEVLALTSNGSRLEEMAAPLRDAGVSRINISLDSLQPGPFPRLDPIRRPNKGDCGDRRRRCRRVRSHQAQCGNPQGPQRR